MHAPFQPFHVWLFLLVPLAAMGLNVAANFLLLRMNPRRSIFQSVLLSTLVGLAGFAAMAWLARDGRSGVGDREWLARMGCGLLAYGCWSYVFFHFVHIPVASVRIRILQELSDHDGLTREAILHRYNGAAILRTRLDRLTRNGQIVRRGDAYVTGRPRLLHVARLFQFVKRLVTGGGA